MSIETHENVVYSGFWIRVVAAVFDAFIMMAVSFIPGTIFGIIVGIIVAQGNWSTRDADLFSTFFGFFLGVFMNFAYFSVFESSRLQGTLGKRIVGVKVTDEDGGRISFGRAAGRYCSKLLSALIFLVGFMMVGWTKRKQGLHDIIACTLVVKG